MAPPGFFSFLVFNNSYILWVEVIGLMFEVILNDTNNPTSNINIISFHDMKLCKRKKELFPIIGATTWITWISPKGT